jgi:hypothetical protein
VPIAASSYAVFESGTELNKLDQLDAVVTMVAVDGVDEYSDCPSEELMRVQNERYKVMCSIAGFIEALKRLDPTFGRQPPSVEVWRESRMKKRAELVSKASESFKSAEVIIDECVKWFDEHPSLVG